MQSHVVKVIRHVMFRVLGEGSIRSAGRTALYYVLCVVTNQTRHDIVKVIRKGVVQPVGIPGYWPVVI
ncbi:MAG: hypothetical protein Kow0063_37370 [Anaerolineae bacterium]